MWMKLAVALAALLYYSPLLLKHMLVGTAPRIDWEAPRPQFVLGGGDAADHDCPIAGGDECGAVKTAGTDMKDASTRLPVSPFTIDVTPAMKDDLAARLALPLRPTKPLFPPGSSEEWQYVSSFFWGVGFHFLLSYI